MYCRYCGAILDVNHAVCPTCGVKRGLGRRYCPNCGSETAEIASICPKCNIVLDAGPSQNTYQNVPPAYAPPVNQAFPGQKDSLVAGLLGIFLGGFGVHRFYLGFNTIGILQLVVTFLTCGIGSIWGFVEGILILAGSMDEDSEGRPLKR